MIKRIVLALDGSPESDYALPITQELALATGAAVTVVHVREMMLAPVVGGVPRRVDATELEERVAADVAAADQRRRRRGAADRRVDVRRRARARHQRGRRAGRRRADRRRHARLRRDQGDARGQRRAPPPLRREMPGADRAVSRTPRTTRRPESSLRRRAPRHRLEQAAASRDRRRRAASLLSCRRAGWLRRSAASGRAASRPASRPRRRRRAAAPAQARPGGAGVPRRDSMKRRRPSRGSNELCSIRRSVWARRRRWPAEHSSRARHSYFSGTNAPVALDEPVVGETPLACAPAARFDRLRQPHLRSFGNANRRAILRRAGLVSRRCRRARGRA